MSPKRRSAAWTLLLCACAGAPDDVPAARSVADAPARAEPAKPARTSAVDLEDTGRAMTLRLPRPGTPRAEVLRAYPVCAQPGSSADDDADLCRFHGWLSPLTAYCEDGCSWWTFRFIDDALAVARLERSVVDVDAEFVARFTAESARVADELSQRLGAPPRVEVLAEWAAVESPGAREDVALARRTWQVEDLQVTWTMIGQPGHHAGITLDVTVTRRGEPRPAPSQAPGER